MTVKNPTIPRVPESVLAALLVALQETFGSDAKRAADVLRTVAYPYDSKKANRLRAAIRAVVGIPATAGNQWAPCTPRQLGFAFRRHLGIEAAGLAVFRYRPDQSRGVQRWCVTTPAMHAARTAGKPVPAPKPVPVPRPRLPKIPVSKPEKFKPIIQQVIRATPQGSARPGPAQALQKALGGFVAKFESRYHLHLPARGGTSAAHRTVAKLRADYPAVAFEVTDTRNCEPLLQTLPEPERHRVPYLSPDPQPTRRSPGLHWSPFNPF